MTLTRRLLLADQLHQLFTRCLLHFLERPVLRKQQVGRLLANALYIFDLRLNGCIASLQPVKRNGKPVRFVANALNEQQRWRLFTDV